MMYTERMELPCPRECGAVNVVHYEVSRDGHDIARLIRGCWCLKHSEILTAAAAEFERINSSEAVSMQANALRGGLKL